MSEIVHLKKNKFDATTAPLKTNDSTEGYTVDSRYVDVVHKQFYRCIENTEDEARWRIDAGVGEFVVNKTGSTILKGSVAYQGTSVGGTPTVVLAKADAETTSKGTWGFIIEDIADNEFGYILTTGILSNLNTSAFIDGDMLYLSDTVAGGMRTTPPPSGTHEVRLGRIDLSHATEGIINVRVDNGIELEEAHNVENTPPSITGQILTFDQTLAYYILDLVIPQMNQTGVVSWAGTGDYYDETFPGGEFRLLRAPTGRIKGKEITPSVPQDTDVLAANTTNFIYIDSAGAIQTTTTRTHALFIDNIVLFEVLYDGTNYEVVREDHPYAFPTEISNDLHDVIGTVFEPNAANMARVTTGTGAVATDRQLKQVGDAEIHDHGLEAELLDSSGSGVTMRHYYTNGTGYYNRDSLSAAFPMKYNNAGTATTLTVGQRGVFPLYLGKDDKNTGTAKLYTVMHTAQFLTLVQAQTAIANGSIVGISNELELLEMSLYGYVIVKNTATGGHIEEVDIQKAVVGGATLGGGTSNQASLITASVTNFDKILSSADTTVQAALETIDEAGASSTEQDTGTAIDRVLTPVSMQGSKQNVRYLCFQIVAEGADVAVGTNLRGDFVLPFSGTILQSGTDLQKLMASVTTAGTTGTMVIDIHYNGTTIMTTNKLQIETGEKTTETAATQPALTATAVTKGGVLTFDIDTVQTTPAVECKVYMAIRETS